MTCTQNFTVTQPTRIRFGTGSVADLGRLVQELGGTKVFLVADPGLKGANILEKITGPLKTAGIPFKVYDKIDPEPGLS